MQVFSFRVSSNLILHRKKYDSSAVSFILNVSQTYLKTLKKKQREANQKLDKEGHKSPDKKKKQPYFKHEERVPQGKYSFSEDDSDLASLAREIEEEEHFQVAYQKKLITRHPWKIPFFSLKYIYIH